MLINEIRPQLMPFNYPWAWEEFKNLCKIIGCHKKYQWLLILRNGKALVFDD